MSSSWWSFFVSSWHSSLCSRRVWWRFAIPSLHPRRYVLRGFLFFLLLFFDFLNGQVEIFFEFGCLVVGLTILGLDMDRDGDSADP